MHKTNYMWEGMHNIIYCQQFGAILESHFHFHKSLNFDRFFCANFCLELLLKHFIGLKPIFGTHQDLRLCVINCIRYKKRNSSPYVIKENWMNLINLFLWICIKIYREMILAFYKISHIFYFQSYSINIFSIIL